MSGIVTQTSIMQAVGNLSASKLDNVAQRAGNTAPNKADDAAKEFEAVYISQMLTPMFETIQTDGMFGGGNAENIYRSMMIDEYGKIIAENGGIGLADALKAQIIEMQAQQTGGKVN